MTGQYTAIDLFCGAGGLSAGLESTGFEICYALDSDASVRRTYNRNLETEIVCEPIEEVDPETVHSRVGDVDLVAGGPPCPTFSEIGRSKIHSLDDQSPTSDNRHLLYEYFLDFVEEFEPTALLMENVEGMTSAKTADGRNVVEHITSQMEDIGYEVTAQVVDAANFGVPQHRKRIFFIGNREGVVNPDLNDWRTHWEPERESERGIRLLREPGAFGASDQTTITAYSQTDPEAEDHTEHGGQKRKPWVTVGEAILDLPPVSPDGSHPPAEASTHVLPPLTEYQQWARQYENYEGPEDEPLYNHRGRYHNLQDLAVYQLLGPGVGWNLGEAEGDLDELHPYRDDVFQDKYKKQNPEQPASTILAHLQKDGHMYIHPREARSLTVREAARLQSFPDSFRFFSSRTNTFRHVGNAVPPRLGKVIGEAIRETVL